MFPVASPARRRNTRTMGERRRSGLSGQINSGNAPFAFGNKRKRKASAISSSYENDDATSQTTRGRMANSQQPQLEQTDLAKLQPLRRTRSLARKMEAFGVPISEQIEGLDSPADVSQQEDEDDEAAANHLNVPTATGESDDESLERSVAEMSLDEISEVADENVAAEPDDSESYSLLRVISLTCVFARRRVQSARSKQCRTSPLTERRAKAIVLAPSGAGRRRYRRHDEARSNQPHSRKPQRSLGG